MAARREMRAADISRALEISQPQISARWHGRIAWSLDELDTLAEVFRCDVADLLPKRALTRGYVHTAVLGLAA